MITLDLSKQSGISLDLKKEDPQLQNLKVLLNWDMHPVHGASLSQGFDLDIWAFALNSSGKVGAQSNIIFYNQKDPLNGAIVLPRDNRTGDGADDEELLIALAKIPADIAQVVLYVFLHDAPARGQNFGMTINANVQLIDNDTGTVIARYDLTDGKYKNSDAICIGALEPSGNFIAAGDASTSSPTEVLNFYQ